ncbi:MAG: hypothetical protein COC12_07565 [Rhodobacteraceae bacterium]|nr:MAG: hypothetical protein COC12_07565 [Paracoccaceae bacterium]
MTGLPWSEHPIFAAETQHDAASRLEMFDDGLVILSTSGDVLHVTSEAARQLGIDTETARGVPLSRLSTKCEGWDDLVAAMAAGHSVDRLLRRADGCEILAAPRSVREADQSTIRMIVLRDLSGLDYRRERASGGGNTTHLQFIAENRTRPDFVAQRRLDSELHRVLSRGERAMVQGARILITGESGVGKTEIAKFLHTTVADADEPFVVANCASSSDVLFARALFGSGTEQGGPRIPGLIEQSEGGTLFLDEVAEIPLSAQALLLRFLEDGLVTLPAGGQHRVVNVRVIAATNRDLRQLVRTGRFRADLYYRLAVVPLKVPPLREMPALIGHLTDRFLRTINQRRQTPLLVPHPLRDLLNEYSYPGNIRELLNIVQKLAIFLEETGDLAELIEDLFVPIDIAGIDGPKTEGAGLNQSGAPLPSNLKSEVRRYERTLIDKAIRVHGSKRKAALALGVDIGTIVRKTAKPTTTTNVEGSTNINTGETRS